MFKVVIYNAGFYEQRSRFRYDIFIHRYVFRLINMKTQNITPSPPHNFTLFVLPDSIDKRQSTAVQWLLFFLHLLHNLIGVNRLQHRLALHVGSVETNRAVITVWYAVVKRLQHSLKSVIMQAYIICEEMHLCRYTCNTNSYAAIQLLFPGYYTKHTIWDLIYQGWWHNLYKYPTRTPI